MIPDYIDPVIGWRSWNILKDNNGNLWLVSPTVQAVWEPGKSLEGRHRYRGGAAGCAGQRCNCGVNAMKDPLDVVQDGYLAPKGMVLGEVSLWGNIREHKRGYRAAYGYPKRLFAADKGSSDAVEALCQKYQIEYGGLVKIDQGLIGSFACRVHHKLQSWRRIEFILGVFALNAFVALFLTVAAFFSSRAFDAVMSFAPFLSFFLWGVLGLFVIANEVSGKITKKAKTRLVFDP